MAAMGYLLRQARKKLGYSMEKMSRITNIEVTYLTALETGQLGQVPQMYLKSYLRTYAKVLGFEPQSFVRYYERGLGELTDGLNNRPASLQRITRKERCDNKLSPHSYLPVDQTNAAFSPRRVAIKAKQNTHKNQIDLRKYAWPIGAAAAIGGVLLVAGGLYFSGESSHSERLVRHSEESPLVANAHPSNTEPYLEVTETPDDSLLGQLYVIYHVKEKDLKVEVKGKKGESTLLYGESPDKYESTRVTIDDIFTLPEGKRWFRLADPSNVEILVNGKTIDTSAQNLPISYRVQTDS